MSVLIKGMEIPKSCDECRIMVFEDTNCAPELYCGCPIVFKAHPQGVGHRPDYCPLVPVPPHGRLGDLDDFVKRMKSLVEKAENNRFDLGVAWYSVFVQHIELTPTIIPAEEGKT